jgi:hypothetical protein
MAKYTKTAPVTNKYKFQEHFILSYDELVNLGYITNESWSLINHSISNVSPADYKQFNNLMNQYIYSNATPTNVDKLNNVAKKMNVDDVNNTIQNTINEHIIEFVNTYTYKTENPEELIEAEDYIAYIDLFCIDFGKMQLGGGGKIKVLGRLRTIYHIDGKNYIKYNKRKIALPIKNLTSHRA